MMIQEDEDSNPVCHPHVDHVPLGRHEGDMNKVTELTTIGTVRESRSSVKYSFIWTGLDMKPTADTYSSDSLPSTANIDTLLATVARFAFEERE